METFGCIGFPGSSLYVPQDRYNKRLRGKQRSSGTDSTNSVRKSNYPLFDNNRVRQRGRISSKTLNFPLFVVHCPRGLHVNATACPVDSVVTGMFIWLVLIGLWLFIYQPLVLWDMRGEFPLTPIYVQCLTVIWLLSWFFGPNKRLLGNRITLALLIYTLAVTMSALFSPYPNALQNYHWQTWVGHMLLFVIFMTSAKTDKDLKTVVAGFLVIYFMYMAHSYWDFSRGRMMVTMGTERLVGSGGRDPNYFATGIMCTLPICLPLVTLCKRYWHYLFVLGFVLLALRLVVLSGSRGGIIALVALAILPIVFSRYRFRILPVILLVLPLGWFFMPEQYQDRIRTIWDPTIRRDAVESTEGRTRGFQHGVERWMEYPIFGTGLGASGSFAHNLPGQLLGDTGTLGVIAFLFLLSCCGINHYNIWKNYKYLQEKDLGKEGLFCWRVSIAVMYGVAMLLCQGLSLHNADAFHWVWFAAFQALAVTFMQEKVTAAMQGKLLPNMLVKK